MQTRDQLQKNDGSGSPTGEPDTTSSIFRDKSLLDEAKLCTVEPQIFSFLGLLETVKINE